MGSIFSGVTAGHAGKFNKEIKIMRGTRLFMRLENDKLMLKLQQAIASVLAQQSIVQEY